MKLTPFGETVRTLRMRHDVSMKSMAEAIGAVLDGDVWAPALPDAPGRTVSFKQPVEDFRMRRGRR